MDTQPTKFRRRTFDGGFSRFAGDTDQGSIKAVLYAGSILEHILCGFQDFSFVFNKILSWFASFRLALHASRALLGFKLIEIILPAEDTSKLPFQTLKFKFQHLLRDVSF
jgi:hypothetical protein